MGDRKPEVSWSWPLVSLEWIPEILSSFDTLIESTWDGLRRQMTLNVPNRTFANRIFSQLQTLMIETELIEKKGRFIGPAIRPNYNAVRNHLIGIFHKSKEDWANYFHLISTMELDLHYEQIKQIPPKEWPDIANYSIFKQWTDFFHFVGLGILFKNNYFVPESKINHNYSKTQEFAERCIKTIGNVRHLTGNFSLHTEADFLAWTRGEDYLPISSDPNFSPRIPFNKILHKWEKSKNQQGAWRLALVYGKIEWYQSISEILSNYPFSDLNNVIFTCKNIIDYFLLGKACYGNDFIDKERLYKIKKMWRSVPHFKMSNQIFELMPNLYRDLTRLFWGISYYRNSLKRPTSTFLYDDSIFSEGKFDSSKKIPIRCYRSKRTLTAILQNVTKIFKAISFLDVKKVGAYYQNQAKTILEKINQYLPPNVLEIDELLRELEDLVDLDPEEKKHILNIVPTVLIEDYPSHKVPQICYWIHKYYEIDENKHFNTVNSVRTKLELMEKQLIKEIRHFQNRSQKWENVCKRLRKALIQRKQYVNENIERSNRIIKGPKAPT